MCAVNAKRHYKELGKAVSWLDIAFIPPILGNAVIILATRRWMALVGCYIYFIGMDFVVYELMEFTEVYCRGTAKQLKVPKWVKWILIADAVQLLINPFTKHAFDVEWVVYESKVYYIVKPFAGQVFHRIADYGVFLAVIIIFGVATFRT